ncbi:hypothetical protein BSKO_11038 [Bryopsis sp. KO-2023]|nr:hypothetical protein BSKO_11038 [Bryopsis sp. KO-2023]
MAGPSRNIQVIDLESTPARVSFVDLTGPEPDLDDEVQLVGETKAQPSSTGRRVSDQRQAPVQSPARGIICPICLERKENELCSPMCGHVLCSQCLSAIMKKRSPVCPICRGKISKSKIIKLHASA